METEHSYHEIRFSLENFLDISLGVIDVPPKKTHYNQNDPSLKKWETFRTDLKNCLDEYKSFTHIRMNSKGNQTCEVTFELIEILIGAWKKLRPNKQYRSFAFFYRVNENTYQEWYHSLREKTMRISEVSDNQEWDFLINIRTKNSWNTIDDKQMKTLLSALEEIPKSEFLDIDKFFFVVISDNFHVSKILDRFANIFDALNPETLVEFGQYIFQPDLGAGAYLSLIRLLRKFEKLKKLFFIITDCDDDEMKALKVAMVEPNKKQGLNHLKLYTGCPFVSVIGNNLFLLKIIKKINFILLQI